MSSNEIAEVKNYSAWILQKKGLWMKKPKKRNSNTKLQTKEETWTNTRTPAPVRELPASSRDAI